MKRYNYIKEFNQSFAPALVIPRFKDSIKSVGQLAKTHYLLFTHKDVYLQTKGEPEYCAKMIGESDQITCTTSRISTKKALDHFARHLQHSRHQVRDNYTEHSTTPTLKRSSAFFLDPELQDYITERSSLHYYQHEDRGRKTCQSCAPSVVRNAKRKPLEV